MCKFNLPWMSCRFLETHAIPLQVVCRAPKDIPTLWTFTSANKRASKDVHHWPSSRIGYPRITTQSQRTSDGSIQSRDLQSEPPVHSGARGSGLRVTSRADTRSWFTSYHVLCRCCKRHGRPSGELAWLRCHGELQSHRPLIWEVFPSLQFS